MAVVKVQREGSNQAGVKFKMTASTAEVMRRQCFSEAPGRPLPSTSSPRSPQFSRAKTRQQHLTEPARCERPGQPPPARLFKRPTLLATTLTPAAAAGPAPAQSPGGPTTLSRSKDDTMETEMGFDKLTRTASCPAIGPAWAIVPPLTEALSATLNRQQSAANRRPLEKHHPPGSPTRPFPGSISAERISDPGAGRRPNNHEN